MGGISTPNSIVVLNYNNKSGLDKLNPLQKGMAVMLTTDLAKVKQLQVVERARMQALLDEMDLGTSGIVDATTAPTVGKLLGAYFVASGDILSGNGQNIKLTSSILDVPFESVATQLTATGELEQLFKLEKKLLFSIVDQLQITLSPAKKAELLQPISTSTTALQALFLGIDYSDKGQYAQAAKMYGQALVEDPDLEMAKSALQELKGMGQSNVENVVAVDEPLSAPPVEAVEDSSTGTYLGIGLALAAIGGAAFALSGSGSSNNDTPPVVDTPPADTVGPTVSANPENGANVSCPAGNVVFSFSESMSSSAGSVSISPQDFAGGSWSDSQHYVVSWEHSSSSTSTTTSSYCDTFTSNLLITFSGLEDTAGNALTGRMQYIYPVSTE